MEKETLVDKDGYESAVQELQGYKEAYASLRQTRAEYGKNTIEDYKTSAYDLESNNLLYHIRRLTESIASMRIISDENADESTVNMGDTVSVLFAGDDDVRKVQIVGGSPNVGREDGIASITINSPMGNAIYKKKIGEVVSYKVKNNEFTVMIVSKEMTVEKQPPQRGE